MASEQDILAACIKDRKAYDMMRLHVGFQELSPLGQHWLKEVEEYYERDKDATHCDAKVLRTLGLQAASAQHEETLAGFFDSLPIIGGSAQNILASILEFQREQVGLRLAALITQPDADPRRVTEILEEYQELMKATDIGSMSLEYVDYDNLKSFYDESKVVPLFPQKIFKHKLVGGGCMPGHHVLIFGRPEQGKSMFAIYQAAAIAANGYKVLYCANEEDPHIHAARAACSLSNYPIGHYREHEDAIMERARLLGLDNIRFLKLEPGTFAEIEAGIRDFNPSVVIVDQLAGIDVGESNPVRAIDVAARRFRTLIGTYGVVGISIAQAGDRTERHGQEPPAYLQMSDVYGSRTGLPAQVDLMLGIGSDSEMAAKNIRAISLPKNKLGGNHEAFRVRFDIERQRVMTL